MEDKPLKVTFVAGEASGDRQGAALLNALRSRVAPRPVTAWGIGGAFLRAAGVDIRHDCAPWGSIGIAATAASIPHLLTVMADMKRALAADPPDALVLIDAGAFNLRLARWAKANRICPVYYYFPPGSWRRSQRAGSNGRKIRLAQVTDRIVTPFPWSAEFLKSEGADAHFVGHPLLDLVRPEMTDDAFYDKFGLDPKRPLVALMPGSRRMEIEHILPAMLGAASEISRRVVGVQFALILASTVSREHVETIIRREQKSALARQMSADAPRKLAQIAHTSLTPPVVQQLATAEGVTMPAPPETDNATAPRERVGTTTTAPIVICEDAPYDVISRSDFVITKSGTSTLEAAILNKPMIIIYRGSPLMAVEYQLRKRSLNLSFIGMPNILAQEEVFPELLQDDATPEAIAAYAVDVLLQPERLLSLKTRVADVIRQTLGEPGGVGRAADLLLETATMSTSAARQA